MEHAEEWEARGRARRINPPLVTRERCRLCGGPLEVGQDWAMQRGSAWPEAYAHQGCVERERAGR